MVLQVLFLMFSSRSIEPSIRQQLFLRSKEKMQLRLSTTVLSLCLATLTANPVCLSQQAESPEPSPGEVIEAENCLVQYISKVKLAARSEGVLTELHFEEGDTVKMGQLIAVIDDTAAALAVALKLAEEKEAVMNAANEVNLEDALNAEELASAESEAYKDLRKEGAIPYWEMEKKRLEAKRAQLRIDLAVMQKKIAEVQMIAKRSERQLAEFELSQRQVKTPSTGFIEARYAQLGEWLQPGSPIATLIQMDRLRVEGDIDALSFRSRVRQGTPVKVVIENDSDPNKAIKIDGKLGYVSMEIDLNNRHRVWVEIQNQPIIDEATGKVIDWQIKPGMRASIKIPQGS